METFDVRSQGPALEGADEDAGSLTLSQAEAAAPSDLLGLRARVEAARASSYVHLRVPLGDDGPPLYVRYGPLPGKGPDSLSGIRQDRRDADPEDQEFLISCDVLSVTCLGLYTQDPRSDEFHPYDPVRKGRALTFSDPELADELGVESSAAAVIEALYPQEGLIIGIGTEVIRFSGLLGLAAHEAVVRGNS
jgi:hypothetical protein